MLVFGVCVGECAGEVLLSAFVRIMPILVVLLGLELKLASSGSELALAAAAVASTEVDTIARSRGGGRD